MQPRRTMQIAKKDRPVSAAVDALINAIRDISTEENKLEILLRVTQKIGNVSVPSLERAKHLDPILTALTDEIAEKTEHSDIRYLRAFITELFLRV